MPTRGKNNINIWLPVIISYIDFNETDTYQTTINTSVIPQFAMATPVLYRNPRLQNSQRPKPGKMELKHIK